MQIQIRCTRTQYHTPVFFSYRNGCSRIAEKANLMDKNVVEMQLFGDDC